MGKVINDGIVVSIGNQKGGVGKSVITSLVANYIHNKFGNGENENNLKIVVADCDDLQGSLYNLRQDELKDTDEKKIYRLLRISSADLPSQIEILKDEFDIVFVDLPGNLKQPGVIQCYNFVDVLITPTQTSRLDIQSTIDFVSLYKETIIPTREKIGFKTKIQGLFSRVDSQNIEFKELNSEEGRDMLPYPFLKNYVPESRVAFQRNVSTVESYSNSKYGNYEDLCEEIIEVITSVR
jgi:chromosome partitioning protein